MNSEVPVKAKALTGGGACSGESGSEVDGAAVGGAAGGMGSVAPGPDKSEQGEGGCRVSMSSGWGAVIRWSGGGWSEGHWPEAAGGVCWD